MDVRASVYARRMVAKKHRVLLSSADRERLMKVIGAGREAAQTLTHARVLLKADQGPDGPAWTDDRIVEALEVSRPTVERLRRRFAEEGLGAALQRRPPRREYRRKLDGEQEARLVALSCSEPPEGHARWSMRLLADKLVALEVVEAVSYETIRRTLKKTRSSRG
jgi:transposase